ncbi:MAG: protocatechuate 3,4-dioxygenase subunit alpha, partial [Candidatus Dormibacteria bacterium]
MGGTPSQTVGPFFAIGMGQLGREELVAPGRAGALRIEGRVLDGAGAPVPDALVEIQQAVPAGGPPGGWSGFGRCATDQEGAFHFNTLKPAPVGDALGRVHAPHLDVQVFARGLLRQLLTRIYFPDEDRANLQDPLLKTIPDPLRRATLVA